MTGRGELRIVEVDPSDSFSSYSPSSARKEGDGQRNVDHFT